ncbi:MAG: extracellular solute-binding protein [Clostridia bacterium]|nr:extracellular solute-binding protein [Clostridia bacterium]
MQPFHRGAAPFSLVRRRILILSLCLCVLGAAAGCGPTPTPAATTTRESGDTGILNPPGTLPVVREPDTLRVFVSRQTLVSSYGYGENSFTTWLQDRTGVQVEFLFPGGDPYYEFRTRLASRGDLGDLVLLQQTYRDLVEYGAAGTLLPLEDLIATYGHHFLDMMDTFPSTLPAITAPDGHIYAFPQGNLVGLNPGAYGMKMWIHAGFLERYGRGMPETTEEFADYLRWVRDADADGDGDPGDEVPWTGSDSREVGYARPTDFLMNAFTLQDEDGYYVQDGVLHCAMVEDGWRRGLRWLRGLYAEDLFDVNYATNDLYGLRAVVASGGGDTVGSLSCGNIATAALDPAIQAKYVSVPPLEGPDGLRYAYYDQYGAGMTPSKAMIPAGSARRELAVAWMDACCDQEVAVRAGLGEEGTDWALPADGTPAADGGPAVYSLIRAQGAEETAQTWLGDSPALWDRTGALGAAARPAGTFDLIATLCDATRLYEPYAVPCAVPWIYLGDVVPEYDDWELSIEMETANAAAEFIYGFRDIDSDKDWDTYLQMVRHAGLDEYMKIRQESYDRCWKGTLPASYTPSPVRTAPGPGGR